MIKVLFFASMAEAAGTDSLTVTERVNNIEDLLQFMAQHHPVCYAAITQRKSYLIAINQQLVQKNAALTFGDEVAFMPPVTGG